MCRNRRRSHNVMETVLIVVAMDAAAVAMETVARDRPVLRQKYVIIKGDRLWPTN